MKVCTIDGCEGAVMARGWCNMHYKRWRKNGDPNAFRTIGRPRGPIEPCAVDGCGQRSRYRGWCLRHYRRWQRHGDPTVAREYGSQPALCVVDGCDTAACSRGMCRTHYLRWLRYGSTDPRPRVSSKTHCKHGHPLSGDNLRIRRRSDGSVAQRVCKACSRASVYAARAKRRAGAV